MASREGGLTRFRPATQVAHFFLFLGMTLSFLTGLALFFKIGENQLFAGWGEALGLPTNPPTKQLISWLHDIIGPVLMLIGVVIALAVSVRPHTIKMALPTRGDLSILSGIVKHRLGMARDRPKVGFYHPLQKVLIWTVVVGLILVGSSGLLLVIEKWFTVKFMSDYARGLVSLLHLIGAFMFFTVLPIHFLMAVAPINWPVLKSQFFFRGRVPLHWWRYHHPAYVEQVLGKEGSREGGGEQVESREKP